MKKFRNWVTFAVVLAMVLSLAVGVSATTSKPAGIYGLVHGTSSQSDSNVNLVATTNWVDKNPDSAYFKISGEYTNGITSISTSSSTSARGLRSYSVSLPVLTPKEGSVCNSTYSPKGTSIWSPITVY